jgi:hypothetical protein
MVTDEQWKPVREFPDDYEISTLGRLRRTSPARGATVGRILSPLRRNGYVAYTIKKDRVYYNRYAHRLLVDAFLGPIPKGMQVNHKNGIRDDCRLENLEIVTNAENRAHSYRVLGVKPNKPSVFGNAVLDWERVGRIREEYAAGGTSHSILAKKYGVCRRTILEVCLKRRWRDEDRPSS